MIRSSSSSDRRVLFCNCAVDMDEAARGRLVFKPEAKIIRLDRPTEIVTKNRYPVEYPSTDEERTHAASVLVICPECLAKTNDLLKDQWAEGAALWVERFDMN